MLTDDQRQLLADEMGITNESVSNIIFNDPDQIISICTGIVCDEYKTASECDISARRFYLAEQILEII
jgi:hypothetical protein